MLVFRFDDDRLDSAASLQRSCDDAYDPQPLQVTDLPGSHITPVFLALGLDDLDFDDGFKDMANQLSDGFRAASFSSEKDLD